MISENERKILRELTVNPFATQQEIADRIGLSRSAVANILSGLTEKGFIAGRQYLLNHAGFVLCVGGANVDRSYQLQKALVPESSNPVIGEETFGGVARNIGENLGRLETPVALMSIVGEDREGERLLLHAARVMLTFPTEKTRRHNTGSYIAVLDPHGELEMGFADMEIAEGMDVEWLLRHAHHLNLCDWIIADCNIQKEAMEELIRYTREREKHLIIVGVSSAKMSHLPRDLSGVRLLVSNREESMAFFAAEETDTKTLCSMWLQTGVKGAVVTAETEAYAYGENGLVHSRKVQAVPREQIRDVTGAGDAFSAGIAYGLIQGHSLENALPYGEALSRLTLLARGSVWQDLDRNDLQKELQHVKLS